MCELEPEVCVLGNCRFTNRLRFVYKLSVGGFTQDELVSDFDKIHTNLRRVVLKCNQIALT